MPNRAPPSPVMPLLLLGILGCILMATTYSRWIRYEYSAPRPVQPVQNTSSVGSFLIPIVLIFIAVQAFELPEPGHPYAPRTHLAFVETMAQKLSFPMFITIILMTFLIGVNLSIHSPWQGRAQPRAYSYGYYAR